MSDETQISPEAIDRLYRRLDREARAAGYNLNPDVEFTKGLVEGLLINEARYGDWACPCRLADGEREKDLDIICPCDYRDADLTEWGACYCALYVSDAVLKGEQELQPIPERRPSEEERTAATGHPAGSQRLSATQGATAAPSGEEEHDEVLVGFSGAGFRSGAARFAGTSAPGPARP